MTTQPPEDRPDRDDERPRDEHDDAHYDALFADIVARWESTPGAGIPEAPAPPAGSAAARAGVTDGDAGDARDDRDARDARDAGAEAPPGRDGAGGTERRRAPLDPADLAWRGSAGSGGTGWRVHVPPPDDEDETYTPPPPAPLPTGDPTFWGALVGLVAGPIWLVYLVIAAPYGPKLPFVAAVALFLGGFALLVSRLPRRRSTPEDDDGDDGAVV